MLVKNLVFVFLLQTSSISATSLNCNSVFEHKTHLNGHCNYFGQNYSEYPRDNPHGVRIFAIRAFEFLAVSRAPVLKFLAVETRPHLFVERDRDGFLIWGPLYSIVQEAAKYINYRYLNSFFEF